MPTTTTTHLNFRGQARDALQFYAEATGGQPAIVTYQDAGAVQDPAEAEQVIWGQVQAAGGFHVMAYDVPSALSYDRGDRSFFVSLRSDTEEETQALWQALSPGATIQQDLAPSGFSPLYGMLTDRFGVTWVLDVAVPYDG